MKTFPQSNFWSTLTTFRDAEYLKMCVTPTPAASCITLQMDRKIETSQSRPVKFRKVKVS